MLWADLTAFFGLASRCRWAPDSHRCTKSACENEPQATLSDCLAVKLRVTLPAKSVDCEGGRYSLAFVAPSHTVGSQLADVPTVV